MAKVRRVRQTQNLPPRERFGGSLDALDLTVYVGIVIVVLATPFLFSRLTTENFLTPKEFASRIALAFLGAAFCIRFLVEQKVRLFRTKLDFPLMLFWGFAVASILWNYNVAGAIRDLRGTFLILLLFPLIVNTVRSRWQFDGILWAMIFAGCATGMLGIMEAKNWYFRFDPASPWGWVDAHKEVILRNSDPNATYIPLFPQLADPNGAMSSIISTFGNRNYLGTFVMFTAFIPMGFFFHYKNIFSKIFSMASFFLMVYGLYITRCRAALLGILAGIVFLAIGLIIFDRKFSFIKRYRLFFVIFACLFVGAFIYSTISAKSVSMFDKLKLMFTMDRKVSNVYERVYVWGATVESFAYSPFRLILGNGFGSFKHFFPLQEATSFSEENKETFTPVTFRQAHNDWLQVISELGLVGFSLFLFLVWRFYGLIYLAIKNSISANAKNGSPHDEGLQDEHILLLMLGAAMTAQFAASIPDFPFHRIETALYAVVVMALIPVLAESSFFTKKLQSRDLDFGNPDKEFAAVIVSLVGIFGGLMGIYFEARCWKADILVRTVDAYISSTKMTPELFVKLKSSLQEAMQKDPLPGDPYLKMATLLEMQGNGQESLDWANKSWKNINFNARSTYHSVVFRQMHTQYYLLQNREEAFRLAQEGLRLTAGDARSIYYFYVGKIGMELGKLDIAEEALKHAIEFPGFATQAGANLALILATRQKWSEALQIASSVSSAVNFTDSTMLDIMGISEANLGHLELAEKHLSQAISLNPDNPIFKRDLGSVKLHLRKFNEAKILLQEAQNGPGLPPNARVEINSMLASISLITTAPNVSPTPNQYQLPPEPPYSPINNSGATAPELPPSLSASPSSSDLTSPGSPPLPLASGN